VHGRETAPQPGDHVRPSAGRLVVTRFIGSSRRNPGHPGRDRMNAVTTSLFRRVRRGSPDPADGPTEGLPAQGATPGVHGRETAPQPGDHVRPSAGRLVVTRFIGSSRRNPSQGRSRPHSCGHYEPRVRPCSARVSRPRRRADRRSPRTRGYARRARSGDRAPTGFSRVLKTPSQSGPDSAHGAPRRADCPSWPSRGRVGRPTSSKMVAKNGETIGISLELFERFGEN